MRSLVAVAALATALAGCSSQEDPGPSAAPATAAPTTAADSPSASVIRAPSALPPVDPQAQIAIGPQTAPADFPGDDEEFLARTRGWLVPLGVEAPAPDGQLVSTGREICSLLSGGGAVASKLDSFAGSRDMVEEGWTAVILAAIDTYCPGLGPGYLADRADPDTTTAAEKLDLTRYAVRLGLGTEPTFTDQRVRDLATWVCDRAATDPEGVLAEVRSSGDPELAVTTLAVAVAYCPQTSGDLVDLLEQGAA